MEISEKLKAIGDMVQYPTAADIGSDHAYLPIYLCGKRGLERVIATDIHQGPYNRAVENIARHGLSAAIQARLGAGLEPIEAGEVKSLVIAGMGGLTAIGILKDNLEKAKSFQQLLLQPQRNLRLVREFLIENRFRIDGEHMLKEEGKYYNILEASPVPPEGEQELYRETEYVYGKKLIEEKSPVLLEFLQKELDKKLALWETLPAGTGKRETETRKRELEKEIQLGREALAWLLK